MTAAAAPAGDGSADLSGITSTPELDTNSGGSGFSLDTGWQLHRAVALRPEPFGALLYHFHTRKLSFLKNRDIVTIVRSLENYSTARQACQAGGVDIDRPEIARLYNHALAALAASSMIEKQNHDSAPHRDAQPQETT